MGFSSHTQSVHTEGRFCGGLENNLYRDSSIVKGISLTKDVLLALQMLQKEVNTRNKNVLIWAARSASQPRPSLLVTSTRNCQVRCHFLGGGSMIRLQMGTRNRNTSKQMATKKEISFRLQVFPQFSRSHE